MARTRILNQPGVGIKGKNYTIARRAIYQYKFNLSKAIEFDNWTAYKIEFVYKSLDNYFPEVNNSFRGFDNVLWDLLDIYKLAKDRFNEKLTWVPTLYKMWYHKCIAFFEYRSHRVATPASRRRYIQYIRDYKEMFGKLAKDTFGIEL